MAILAFFAVLILGSIGSTVLVHAGLSILGGLWSLVLTFVVAPFIAWRTHRWRRGLRCKQCNGTGRFINEQGNGYVPCLPCAGNGRVRPDSFLRDKDKTRREEEARPRFVNGGDDMQGYGGGGRGHGY